MFDVFKQRIHASDDAGIFRNMNNSRSWNKLDMPIASAKLCSGGNNGHGAQRVLRGHALAGYPDQVRGQALRTRRGQFAVRGPFDLTLL